MAKKVLVVDDEKLKTLKYLEETEEDNKEIGL